MCLMSYGLLLKYGNLLSKISVGKILSSIRWESEGGKKERVGEGRKRDWERKGGKGI